MKHGIIDYNLLTPEQRELLLKIQKEPSVNTYGYNELIITVLEENRYRVADTDWLNLVRMKWVTYLKEKPFKDKLLRDIINNTKSW